MNGALCAHSQPVLSLYKALVQWLLSTYDRVKGACLPPIKALRDLPTSANKENKDL